MLCRSCMPSPLRQGSRDLDRPTMMIGAAALRRRHAHRSGTVLDTHQVRCACRSVAIAPMMNRSTCYARLRSSWIDRTHHVREARSGGLESSRRLPRERSMHLPRAARRRKRRSSVSHPPWPVPRSREAHFHRRLRGELNCACRLILARVTRQARR
jgi:hypothetical protein